ncbi:DUF2860 family protein [Endozoicomonas ascidiicola]|uniref:DUF2860 family protein n=1 Tax=Endozoicomonas ascidiicola TaxID=1698521 RepID=UPI0008306058|nr:DUF2860 family protein [Endozoicomonas ascidiicola]
MKKSLFCMISAFALSMNPANSAHGVIPDEDGFSGFVTLGLSGIDLKSNTVAGDSTETFSKKRISSLTASPKSESKGAGYITGELKYTWADNKTQVFLGNRLEDWIRYDFTSELGIRHQYRALGEFSASLLFSAFPTRVWQDPYQLNSNRRDTDRKSTGASFGWNNIMGSDAQITLSARKIEIDKEHSGEHGQNSNLSPEKRYLLSRKGDSKAIEFLYHYQLNDSQTLIPSLKATHYDLDGKAMASDEYLLQLSHLWGVERWRTVSNLVVGRNKHDKANPIEDFKGKTQKDDIYGASFTLFYSEPFGWKNWNAMGSVAVMKSSSNIDFYEADISALSLGMLYRF